MPIALAPFDPSRDFVAKTGFRAAGLLYQRNNPFRKDTVNDRVLRQLYDSRKIGYPEERGPKKKSHKRMGSLLASFAASVLAHARWDHHHEGASGTARKAPGAEGSTSAASGSASAPEPKGAGRPDKEPAPDSSNAEADATAEVPTKADGAADATAGDSVTAAADRAAKIERVMIDNNHKQLVEKAKDLPGINSKTPKATIAAALVDAGTAA